MEPEKPETFKKLFYLALIPTEAQYKTIIKSSIKYCVGLDNDGNLNIADWLNDYPEIKKEIEEKYNEIKSLIR